jgi:predicted metal-dependent phosphoesterase TrpH
MIDLHCHSHFSDGTLTPQALILMAQQQAIQCLSLTDHDTLAGYPQLNEAAAGTSIQIVQGIELSARWKKQDIHVLGYHIHSTSNFAKLLANQKLSRISRAEQISALLELTGVKNAYAKACEVAGHSCIGRLHLARVLMNEGKVKDLQSAFRQFLGRGKRAFVPSAWISLQEAIEGIQEAGGQAVIAHPLKYGLTRSKLHELIKEFKEAGGVGLEVVSGELTLAQINEMAGACLRFDLLASSGSDYHGTASTRVKLGGQRQLPAHCKPIWHSWGLIKKLDA